MSASGLARERCVACRPGAPMVTEAELQELALLNKFLRTCIKA